ncbi:MAG: transcription-repair coupling factor [Firmicutes bacterium]|nr:transcription-repair coupling factor [Bacillota bacterium]
MISTDFRREALAAEREYSYFRDTLKGQLAAKNPHPTAVTGLSGGAAYAFFDAVISDVNSLGFGTLIISHDEGECARIISYLSAAGKKAVYFPYKEPMYHAVTSSHEAEMIRIAALDELLRDETLTVVTTPDAALEYTISEDELAERSTELSLGTEITHEALAARLVAAGYSRTDAVGGVGHFAVRGDIFDIYTYPDRPIRIEFFGDEIDRIALFDTETGRAVEQMEVVRILPVRELYADAAARGRISEAASRLASSAKKDSARAALHSEAEAAEAGLPLPFADKYSALIRKSGRCLFDYMKSRRAVIMTEYGNIKKRLEAYISRLDDDIKYLITEGLISKELADFSLREDKFEFFAGKNAVIYQNVFSTVGLSGMKLAGVYGFTCRRGVSYNGSISLLSDDISSFVRAGYRIAVMTAGEAAASVTCESLIDSGIPAVTKSELSPSEMEPSVVYVVWGEDCADGFELPLQKFALLSFTKSAKKPRTRKIRDKREASKTREILSYNEIKPGDYVVHASYGIGQYMGLETLTSEGVSRDYVKIRYAGSDLLFLPTDALDLLSKYIGSHSEDGTVKLSKMGGAEWSRAKSRAKAAARDMAEELIALYAQRQRTKGFAFPADDEYQAGFEDAFEYEETPSQKAAANEIKRDMEKPYPMDRLLCGDVGFGKTEVALRAAFKAILAGKQVAFLVPTTILAYQHFSTASARFRPYPMTVEMISRLRSKDKQEEILRRLRRGEIDLLIGTHRLISQDVQFRDLGLLIIDEEQRFGVAQKEKLKQLSVGVDVLTLTATPIPRTLNMAMNGIKDMSLLEDAPGNRLPVETYVTEFDEDIINEAIRRELRRGGQVFYLHNRIDSIYTVAASLNEAFPDARVTVAHGQMEKDTIEDIWQSLVDGETDILVCTTIIEAGIDVPNANTLIIEDADRFGLSQLHQIRGRVGRSERRAYAYFTYRRGKSLTEIGAKRLSTIREYAEFGAGFRIALRDMELRGAGNLLGAEQHGHLDAVGYDLYIKLLEEAVIEERGGKAPEPPAECKINIAADALLPATYVSSGIERIELYKKIARIETKEDEDDIADELTDKYGTPPKAVENLLKIAYLRAVSKKCGILSIDERSGKLNIKPKDISYGAWSELDECCRGMGSRLRVISAATPYLEVTVGHRVTPLEAALRFVGVYSAHRE